MADAKITLTVEGAQYAIDSLGNVSKAAGQTGQAFDQAAASAKTSSGHVSGLTGYLNELTPSTKNAGAAFTDLKGTLTEMWESPTAALGQFSKAVGGDLAGGLGSIGVAAGAAAAGVAVFSAASFELAEHAAAVGGALNDMSEKTGISVPALSNLSGAVQIAGGSLDQVSAAIFKFQQNLGEGSDKFVAGLQRLHVSLDDIKNQSPDQQFLTIAAAIKGVEDPSQRAAAAVELFGKQGKDLLPLLNKPLDELVEKSRALGLTWTTEDAAAAEELEMQTNALRLEVQQFATSVGRDLIPQMTGFVKILEDTGLAFHTVGEGITSVVGLATGFSSAVQDAAVEAGSLEQQILGFVDSTTKAAGAVKGFKGPIDDYVNSIHNGLPTQAEMKTNLRDIEEETRKVIAAQKEAAREQERQRQLWEEYNAVGKNVFDTIGKLDGRVVEAIKYDLQRGETVETLTKIYGVHNEQIKAIEQEEKFLASVIDTTTKSLHGMTLVVPTLTGDTGEFREHLDDLDSTSNQFSGGLSVMGDALDHVTTEGFIPLIEVVPQGTKVIQEATNATDKLTFGLEHARLSIAGVSLDPLIKEFDKFLASDSGKSVVDLLSSVGMVPPTTTAGKALTAGITVGAGILASATNNAETKTGQVLHTTAQGAEIGAQFGGPIGAAAGAGIGALVGALKVSPEELAARSSLENWIKQFTTDEEKALGKTATLNDAIAAVGKVYASIGKTGAQAQHDLQAAFDASHQSADAEAAALDKVNLVLYQASLAAKGVQDSVNLVTTAGQAFGGIVPDQFKSAVAELANMQGITDEERASLLAMTGDVKPNFDQLTQTAANYGITLAGLGPKFQEANIEGRAKGIFDDFSSLTKAGADVGGVLQGMGGKISKLVDDSENFGAAIPDNMKPLIENLFDSGQLLDENGQKITDLGQITWEDTPLEDSYTKLQSALDRLTDTLNHLPGAAQNAANGMANALSSVHSDLSGDGNDGLVPGAATGGWVTSRGIQTFPTVYASDGWGSPRGTDTVRAWLTPGEVVLNKGQQRAFGSVSDAQFQALHAEMRGLRADLRRMQATHVEAVTAAVKVAGRR